MWQALETKARFIAQVMTGESAVRRAEDIGGQELSYAEVKAIASGNPAVLTLAEADAELQRLSVLRKNHADEQYIARRSLRELPETIDRLTKRVADLTADMATLAAHEGKFSALDGRPCHRTDVPDILAGRLKSLPEKVHETRRVPFGIYHGLKFGLVLHPHGAPEVFLEGATTRHANLSREHQGPRAILNAAERLTESYESQRGKARQDLAIAQGQLRDYQARLGAPFMHEAYMEELTRLRDQLKVGLSGATPEPGADILPPVADLAERIGALRAAHTVEAAPQRLGARNRAAAEQPVTARIRRQAGASPLPKPELGSDDSTAPAEPSPQPMPPPGPAEHAEPAPFVIPFPDSLRENPARPGNVYRERVARDKKSRQLSLF
jgi:hypothetical protein